LCEWPTFSTCPKSSKIVLPAEGTYFTNLVAALGFKAC
jgi:hypothetical protein